MKITSTLTLLACTCALSLPGAALAQGADGDYKFRGSLTRAISPAAVLLGVVPAEELPAVGQPYELLDVFHLARGYGIPQKADAAKARLAPPDGHKDKPIIVDFGSRSLNTVISGLLVNAGYTVVEDPAAAALVFRGQAQYFTQAIPFSSKRFVLDQRIDVARLDDMRDNLVEGGQQPVVASAFKIGLASAMDVRDPITLSANLLYMVMQHTGLAERLAKNSIDAPETLKDSWLHLDCYDKSTRKAGWCISDGQKLESYLRKVRVEAVVIQGSLNPPGASNLDSMATQVVVRRIGSRSDPEIHLQQLLSAAVNELVAGFQPLATSTTEPAATEVKP